MHAGSWEIKRKHVMPHRLEEDASKEQKRPFGENGLIPGPAQKLPLGPDERFKTLTVGGRVTGVMFVRIVDEELGGEGENANDHKRSFVIF